MRRRQQTPPLTLPMAPMIDVVCLLLIFFLVVFRPQTLLSGLDVSSASKSGGQPYPTLIRISVDRIGYTLQGLRTSLDRIDERLAHLRTYSAEIPVTVHCTHDSTHSQLVTLLDTCAKNDITKVSITSP